MGFVEGDDIEVKMTKVNQALVDLGLSTDLNSVLLKRFLL